eukprot:TRINITY_DN12642_c0_g1_i1.p1 TRINITY_DN12642_c0_g1~~TRINITY_DN12642_c0_g1_i1.p1  ORF type:complete len:298 (+),score=87.43 TRINITY_DN12642_c0_g1_i1:72-965(+)
MPSSPLFDPENPIWFFFGICFAFLALVKLYQVVISPSKPKQRQDRKSGISKFIGDNYKSLEQVQQALREAGLESSNLIIGVDFTASNAFTGKKTFGGKCLHLVSHHEQNPYQKAIAAVGRTLEGFDDDNLIPTFGFGDQTTKGFDVFPFHNNGAPCVGIQEVLQKYEEIAPHIIMSGPTNFAPLIRQTINIVSQNREYHILLIIADGQVTCEQETVDAIVEASKHPISIVMIGVGDGPWDMMEEFDDELPERQFDNFQFVDFNKVMSQSHNKDHLFALNALMEIPDQFKSIRKLKLL